MKSVLIHDRITTIGANAFAQNKKLVSVAITDTASQPSQLSVIGELAFENDKLLTTFAIPASVSTIGSAAFGNNYYLYQVTFAKGSKLTAIGDRAFAVC